MRRTPRPQPRDPVENAFYAFAALSAEQKRAMVKRYNDHQAPRGSDANKLTWGRADGRQDGEE